MVRHSGSVAVENKRSRMEALKANVNIAMQNCRTTLHKHTHTSYSFSFFDYYYRNAYD